MNGINDMLDVFSAHAEVVPKGLGMGTVAIGILRARGGSSALALFTRRG